MGNMVSTPGGVCPFLSLYTWSSTDQAGGQDALRTLFAGAFSSATAAVFRGDAAELRNSLNQHPRLLLTHEFMDRCAPPRLSHSNPCA